MSAMSERVVVPIDFSELSENAVREGLRQVAHPSLVHVLYVLSPVSSGAIWHDPAVPANVQAVEKKLKDWLDRHRLAGVTAAVRVGRVADEIVRFSDELPADLIVIPSHGADMVTHLLIGSVTERVVRLAHCAVLVLRQRHTAPPAG